MSLAATALTFVSCSSTAYKPIDATTPGATFEEGVPGGTLVDTYRLTATVTSLDPSTRLITLVGPDGRKIIAKCGPEVAEFDQFRVGDRVNATVRSRLTVAMSNANDPRTNNTAAKSAVSPQSGQSGGPMAETQEYIATIAAIDLKRHEATLRLPDGTTRTFGVRKDVDLTQRQVGEEVNVRVTMAIAVLAKVPQR